MTIFIQATATSSSTILLTWEHSSLREQRSERNQVVLYVIERKRLAGGDWTQIGEASQPRYADTELEPDTAYDYRVHTRDSSLFIGGRGTTWPAAVSAPRLTAAQAISLANQYCGALGQKPTLRPSAQFPSVAAGLSKTYGQPCWKITFENEAEINVADGAGVISDYSNHAHDRKDRPLQTFHAYWRLKSKKAPLTAASALQKANAAIEATGQQEPLGLPECHLSPPQGGDHSHFWMARYPRLWVSGSIAIPYRENYAVVQIDARTGTVVGMGLIYPTRPVLDTVVSLAADEALVIAEKQIACASLPEIATDAFLVSSPQLQVVQPNTYWVNGSEEAQQDAAHIAWVVPFVENLASQYGADYEVWVDAASGAVVGGEMGAGQLGYTQENRGD